jgi:hypothetical protein
LGVRSPVRGRESRVEVGSGRLGNEAVAVNKTDRSISERIVSVHS